MGHSIFRNFFGKEVFINGFCPVFRKFSFFGISIHSFFVIGGSAAHMTLNFKMIIFVFIQQLGNAVEFFSGSIREFAASSVKQE